MKENTFLKVCVTGPESTGKTAIAVDLARRLDMPVVPEFARYYVGHLGRPYEHADLTTIASGQKIWEQWYTSRIHPAAAPGVLICDTDWTVLHVWEQYRFGVTGDFRWEKGYGAVENADLYLLCEPDFPWQPDPVREHPEERHVLFALYENLLQERQANFITLSGSHENRLQIALAAIRQLF